VSHTADVVIVGAGIIGGSIAFHLLERDPRLRIVMLEKEAEPGTGATSKATGGVRFQFSTEANVRLTQLSYRYFTHSEAVLGSPVDFLRHGYLFVTTEAATLEQCRRNVALQRGLGVPSELLTPGAIQDHLDCLVTRDLVGGSFCPDDGSADPYSMLRAFLARARGRGLRLLTDHPVVGLVREGERVTGARTPHGDWSAPLVIDCAGPYADQIGAIRRLDPLEAVPAPGDGDRAAADPARGVPADRGPRQRLLRAPAGPERGAHGRDRQGHQARPRHRGGLGRLRRGLPRGRGAVPPLAEAQVMRAYAGVRDPTPDYHGILGPATAAPGLHVACGFSGHGFMHAPAIGILMTEILLDGRARSMDVAALSLDRFAAGRLRAEANMF